MRKMWIAGALALAATGTAHAQGTDVGAFFDAETIVPIDFRPAYFEKLVAVPAGGSSGAIEIRVQSK